MIAQHNRWRNPLKIATGLFLLLMGCLFGLAKYEGWREAKQQAAQEVGEEAQKRAHLLESCQEWEAAHPLGSPLDMEYIKPDGTVEEHPTDKSDMEFTVDPLTGCHGPLETDYENRAAAFQTGVPVDCYDENGNLIPNLDSEFNGYRTSCGPGETVKPRSH